MGIINLPQIVIFLSVFVLSVLSDDAWYDETWDYTEVREGAHMFWWLQYTTHPDGYKQRPLIIWLQGGPGVSGVGYGNFDIIGPIDVDLNRRNSTWLQSASLLFVDSPVGTGYSYVDHKDDLTTDVHQATSDLMVFTKKFFSKYSDFQAVPYYIFSQSYGGKFAVEYAWRLLEEISKGSIACDLRGYALGNSWVDPVESILGWASLLHEMSVVDEAGYGAIQTVARQAAAAAAEGRWAESARLWSVTQDVVGNRTNNIDWYNVLNYNTDANDFTEKLRVLMNGPVREKLGIIPSNVTWEWSNDDVFWKHDGDFMKDTLDTIATTLNDTNMVVVVFQGQLDLICNSKAAMAWVQKLKWPGISSYNKAARTALLDPVTGQTDTYVKAYKNFKFYWNLRTGHAVAKLMGDAALRMLERIFSNQDQ